MIREDFPVQVPLAPSRAQAACGRTRVVRSGEVLVEQGDGRFHSLLASVVAGHNDQKQQEYSSDFCRYEDIAKTVRPDRPHELADRLAANAPHPGQFADPAVLLES